MTSPKPVQAKVKVGSYYFPGHFHAGRWAPMRSYGSPTPLLGYYRDGAPGVTDWHIKWAVEHGLSYFVFDWYYDHHTGTVAEHNTALDQGFLKAEFCDLMEFAIFWCNEEALTEPLYTEAELVLFGKTLGERYFLQANYLQVDGRPVVFISRPSRWIASLGDRTEELLTAISAAAGLPTGKLIYFVALQSHDLAGLKAAGFSACSAYNYANERTLVGGSPLRATYADMVTSYERLWNQVRQDGALPYIVPLSPGWDSRPWYREQALVRTGATPALFEEMCKRALDYVDPRCPLVISECWNEFGEGSYLEPTEQQGFEALDALRRVFCAPDDWPPNGVPTARENNNWVFQDIPDDPLHLPPSGQTGNLLAAADMEQSTGWGSFAGGPVTFSIVQPHSGRQCLVVEPDKQAKSLARVALEFGRRYQVEAWVKCQPGASVTVNCALFGSAGQWLERYTQIGTSDSPEWTAISLELPATDREVASVDLEFVASDGLVYADDASVTAGDYLPGMETLLDSSTGTDWERLDGAIIEAWPLVLEAGTGAKTRQAFSYAPGATWLVEADVNCSELATLELLLPLFNSEGSWLERYTPMKSSLVSWQDWGTVTWRFDVPEGPQEQAFRLEFRALGEPCEIRKVKLLQIPAQ